MPCESLSAEGAFLRVFKDARILELWVDGTLLLRCGIGLGFAPRGHKRREGDGRTPEGRYFICTRNGASRFYLSLGISYPGVNDARDGLAEGLIDEKQYSAIVNAAKCGRRPPWGTPLGGEIMIHGHGGQGDWTAGCIAVEDGDMDILWQSVPLGTPIEILR